MRVAGRAAGCRVRCVAGGRRYSGCHTDGTHDSVLLNGSEYSGPKLNKYAINTGTSATYNYGLGRICAFGPNGVYFVRCTGEWSGSGGQTSKVLCYADRATGVVRTVLDISAVDDDHQAMSISNDGRKVLSWCHSRTIAMDVNATYNGGSYHAIPGIWGHGPIIPSDGSVVIINAIAGQCDVQQDHRTWVVYDWTNGACGTYLHRYISPATSPTGTGTQAIVRGSTSQGQNGDDYIVFGTDNGNAYLLHWSTGAAEQISHFGEVYLGVLPTGDRPVLWVAPQSLAFTASGSQSVTVTNAGAGTLTAVSTSIAYANGSGWLTAAVQGSGGNSQTIANTVNASSLASGNYSATVTVSGGGASSSVTYAVSVSLGVPGNLTTSVSGTRYRHVTLTWTDNSTGETGYSIERSFNGGAYSVDGTAPANATSYVDSNVTCSTSGYSYRLRASFSGGTYSGYSAASAVTVSCADWIDVTAPTTGAVYRTGDTIWIRWDASNVGQVFVEGTLNGGDDFVQISTTGGISTGMPGWGNYPWVPVLPAGTDSTQEAFVRVAKYTDRAGIFDVSGTFTVRRAPSAVARSAVSQGAAVSGLKHRGLVSLAAASNLVYTLKPGEVGTIRIFRPDGVLVHSIVCTEAGTNAVVWDNTSARGAAAGTGMYLIDMVVR